VGSVSVRAKKSLGQNFLMHASIAERIADVSGIKKHDTVLEIGPGTGMLTRALLSRAKKVIAVEADRELFEELKNIFREEVATGRLELIHKDIREFSMKHALPYMVVANIPYYLTGELFRQFLSATHQPKSMTLLVQKEVAVRVAREKKESVLSLSIKAYGVPAYEFTVPKGAFIPAPTVDSAVLSITSINRKNFKNARHEERFFELLKAGFAHKRKLLASNLTSVFKKGDVSTEFLRVGIEKTARAEDIALPLWLMLAEGNS
jgi:16S rRNA (adenine1518-N6/adenine1519-N6)-dimethyltransferase